MNWVGGARSRVKLTGERKLQKEFFDKVKAEERRSKSKHHRSKKTISQDLLAIRTINQASSANNDHPEGIRRAVREIDMDRRGLFHGGKSRVREVVLHSSPGETPSCLVLSSPELQYGSTPAESPFEPSTGCDPETEGDNTFAKAKALHHLLDSHTRDFDRGLSDGSCLPKSSQTQHLKQFGLSSQTVSRQPPLWEDEEFRTTPLWRYQPGSCGLEDTQPLEAPFLNSNLSASRNCLYPHSGNEVPESSPRCHVSRLPAFAESPVSAWKEDNCTFTEHVALHEDEETDRLAHYQCFDLMTLDKVMSTERHQDGDFTSPDLMNYNYHKVRSVELRQSNDQMASPEPMTLNEVKDAKNFQDSSQAASPELMTFGKAKVTERRKHGGCRTPSESMSLDGDEDLERHRQNRHTKSPELNFFRKVIVTEKCKDVGRRRSPGEVAADKVMDAERPYESGWRASPIVSGDDARVPTTPAMLYRVRRSSSSPEEALCELARLDNESINGSSQRCIFPQKVDQPETAQETPRGTEMDFDNHCRQDGVQNSGDEEDTEVVRQVVSAMVDAVEIIRAQQQEEERRQKQHKELQGDQIPSPQTRFWQRSKAMQFSATANKIGGGPSIRGHLQNGCTQTDGAQLSHASTQWSPQPRPGLPRQSPLQCEAATQCGSEWPH